MVLSTTTLFSQSKPLQICVVQYKEGFDDSQVNGWDAESLARELSLRKLEDGTPLMAIAIRGESHKVAQVEMEGRNCSFVVTVWRHQNIDRNATDSAPGALSPADQIPITHDQDGISYELRGAHQRKKLLSGFTLPPTTFSKSSRVIAPFPRVATQMVSKLSTLR